jgi:hypothetical protein
MVRRWRTGRRFSVNSIDALAPTNRLRWSICSVFTRCILTVGVLDCRVFLCVCGCVCVCICSFVCLFVCLLTVFPMCGVCHVPCGGRLSVFFLMCCHRLCPSVLLSSRVYLCWLPSSVNVSLSSDRLFRRPPSPFHLLSSAQKPALNGEGLDTPPFATHCRTARRG